MDRSRALQGHPTHFWRRLENGQVECGICPRACHLQEGQRGFCFVRGNVGGAVVLHAYGLSSGFCIDPIEKKPLNHFLPGASVLSFGTAGCNLGCQFCQNWDISKSRTTDSLSAPASPEAIAEAAKAQGCRAVAFTYNDPVVFHEYAVDTAKACHAAGVRTVAVSAGYQNPEPRAEFYAHMDAVNIDLKAFSERFYQRVCGGQLAPVLETLSFIKHETATWLEITTLLIPGENDSTPELEALTHWIFEHLGPDVPLHFSAFHPDWKMRDTAPTPLATLLEARRIAKHNGLRHVYVGNVACPEGESTLCHQCGKRLIGRDRYKIFEWQLSPEGACLACGAVCAGVFEPGPGTWGTGRKALRI